MRQGPLLLQTDRASYGSFPQLMRLGRTKLSARTNLGLQSQNFMTSPWTSNGSPTITAASLTAPDGTSTGTTFAASVANAGVFQFTTTVSGSTYVDSIYLMPVSGAALMRVGSDTSGTNYSQLNLSTLAITNLGNAIGTVAQTTNGFYRFMVAWTAGATSSSVLLYNQTVASVSWGMWGFQRELGLFASSYDATTTASASSTAYRW